MRIAENQMPEKFIDIIEEELKNFRKNMSITRKNNIPDTTDIPIENSRYWLEIPDVICVYIDMKNSTKLSTNLISRKFASIAQLFTDTAVKIFHEIKSPYIDIKGDGIFALFNNSQPHLALVGAVLFKTFVKEEMLPRINEDSNICTGVRIGIDTGTVLVRKIGLKFHSGRTDRQNELWAGKPVNISAKLLSLCEEDQIIASDRYYNLLEDKKAIISCGCQIDSNRKCTKDEIVNLWEKCSIEKDNKFDFNSYYIMKSIWCPQHGNEYCSHLLKIDQ